MQLSIPTSKRQQLADNEVAASDYIPFSHFNSPTIFETKDNAQGCVISVRGIPFEVEDTGALNYLAKGINNIYQSLSDEFAVYVTTYRHLANQYPPGEFPPGFAHDFNEAYKQKFLGKKLFKNDIYMTVIIKGGTGKIRKSISFIEKLSHKAVKGGLEAYRARQAKKLETAVRHLLESLQPYAPTVLGEHTNKIGAKVSELLEFFSILVNAEKRSFLFPYEDIASYLPTKRLFFGHNAIQIIGNTKEDSQFLAVLSIKKYCPETAPGMLDALLKAPFEYIATHSFLRVNDNLAKELIKQQRSRLRAVNDESETQIVSLDEAANDLASGLIAFGYHHNSIVCIGKTLQELESQVATLTKLYQDQDITVIRETLNMESAFWAQLPGNFSRIRRNSLISSQNMAYFCPLHNYHHGYIDQNHLGSALIQVETLSQTPLYVNFHERASGNKNDLSKGHTTIIAPSNAGKTTLMTAFDAQAQKYKGKSVFFDRDRGLEIYVRANNGSYATIMPGHPTGFNPLQLPDKPANRDFLKKWLGSLLLTENDPLTATDEEQIANVINRNYTLPFEKRNLSNITSFFPSDFSKLPAFMISCGSGKIVPSLLTRSSR